MPSQKEKGVAQEKARLLLYIHGVLAVRTIPLDDEARAERIANWGRIYGRRSQIVIEAA